MNDLESEFENDLRRVRPVEPSRGLAGNLDRQLRPTAGRDEAAKTRLSLRLAWSLAAAASFAAVLAWWPAAAQSDPPRAAVEQGSSASELVPVGLTTLLYDARDEGFVVLEDGRALRKLRIRYVDTIELADRSTRASLEISRPAEEIRLVPVRFD